MAKKRTRQDPSFTTVAVAPTEPKDSRQGAVWPEWIARRAALIAVILTFVATARIAAVYPVYSHTSDEPAHLACGMELLSQRHYGYEHQHPPLARLAVSLLPFLTGARTIGSDDMWIEGRGLLIKDGKYERTLTLARLGNLPFFWIASAVVFLWARRIAGPAAAVAAVLLFTGLPIVLGHAGLATTDMALTAMLAAALYSFLVLVDQTSWPNASLFGLCGGLAIASKFSALVFFPCAVAAAALGLFLFAPDAKPRIGAALRDIAPKLAASAAVAVLAIWAVYGFSFGKIESTDLTVPFPELFTGIRDVAEHNSVGHAAFFLGERKHDGWFAFFPVLVAVKTPLAFLALAAVGLFRARHGRGVWSSWVPWMMALGIFLFAMTSRINIGLRHILPVYIMLSIGAASGLLFLLRLGATRPWATWAAAALLVWNIGHVAINHPDYLPYFNELAGDEPENIAVDSDLDWGQDLKRLAARLREVGAGSVTFSTLFSVDLGPLGFPKVEKSDPRGPSPGWNAVSLTYWKNYGLGAFEWKHTKENSDEINKIKVWPDVVPKQQRVGRGILLYYFADPDAPKQ
ncbi:MAG: glycosyltransferase family 39 protein [Bryobacteraceae bacterium]